MRLKTCRTAVLDIGSQTFRMAGAEIQGSCVKILFSERENVRLGRGLEKKGIIGRDAMKRGLLALQGFGKTLKSFSISRVRAAGTAALRNASNAGGFLKEAGALGFSIDIIDWKEEASAAARGAYNALGGVDSPWIMIDVGGGSSEVVMCGQKGVVQGVSLPVGAVSLLETLPAGRVSAAVLSEAAGQLLESRLSAVFPGQKGLRQAVATGGTATTIAAVELGLDVYDPRKIRGLFISLPRLREILSCMQALGLKERRKIRGLEPGRADIFPAGIAILAEIVSYLDLDGIIVSDGGLLSGLLAAFMEKECNFYVEPSCARSLYL